MNTDSCMFIWHNKTILEDETPEWASGVCDAAIQHHEILTEEIMQTVNNEAEEEEYNDDTNLIMKVSALENFEHM
ncbi:hypothetical protein FQA39_LY13398 [Lamprigera yunnana]|nr:hypothetical protein FQA39_LY13398 [Lamprigera yunnana]